MRLAMIALSLAAFAVLAVLGVGFSRAIDEIASIGAAIASTSVRKPDVATYGVEPSLVKPVTVLESPVVNDDAHDAGPGAAPPSWLEYLPDPFGEVSADDIGELRELDAEFEQAFDALLAAPGSSPEPAALPAEVEGF